MELDYTLPEGLMGRFAVVKLWPEVKNAEDECIARLKIAARALGMECVEVNGDGSLVADPSQFVAHDNVDFVLHLHFDTPKNYDAFSFVALWNPLNFYREWGYGRTSRNLTSHDDFISCSSDAADDHVRRMIRSSSTHMAPKFKLYHSTPDIIHEPSLGDGKLAYAGINWDALRAGQSRHQEVLKKLDPTGMLRIYGPHIFLDVQVWKGYDSYVKEVPFDGTSMVDEISKAGAALVLSSQGHKEAGIMSNRLFETLAAGALVICDENPFAKRFFGDCLLYIDSRDSVEQQVKDITDHMNWARSNPDAALAMIARAQAIMRTQFTLIENLRVIYDGLTARKAQLGGKASAASAANMRVCVNFLMPEYSAEVLDRHIASAARQDYLAQSACLVIDGGMSQAERDLVDDAVARARIDVEVVTTRFFERNKTGKIVKTYCLGSVINTLISAQRHQADAFMIVAPNETLLHSHVSVLAGALLAKPTVNCAATAARLTQGDARVNGVHEIIDFGHVDRAGPPGYGRFIFRMAAIPDDIDVALPYLHGRPLAVLVGDHKVAQLLAASIAIDLEEEYPARAWNDDSESDVIRAYSPGALTVATGAMTPELYVPAVVSKRQLVRLLGNRNWLRAQVGALRKEGFTARFKKLIEKLS
ncbi:MAG: glycosyltransferase [Alphaproteobacteria bacterium]|nr:glycosyltransferase [Alphaproteobacteria bacterium]MBU1562600.1 glycosyltransferase [Alphaproteobacteria bacterium]MBU2303242.1 glycosyltransferase [Alphaproteobacteria bacterium]MBU2370377.1 glycosyltransferase [Alphaproteobacteria bacterium]